MKDGRMMPDDVRRIRRQLGLSQLQLARLLDVSIRTLYRLEHVRTPKRLQAEVLRGLAAVSPTRLQRLLEESSDSTPSMSTGVLAGLFANRHLRRG